MKLQPLKNQNQEDMRNRLSITLFAILIIFMTACKGNHKANMSNKETSKPIVTVQNSILDITSLNKSLHNVKISVNGIELFNKEITDSWHSDIIDLLKEHNDFIEIAYIATNSIDNSVAIKVQVDNSIDTTFNYAIKPMNLEFPKTIITGKCAPLYSNFSSPNLEVDLKRWLFKRKENVGKHRIDRMLEIVRTLKFSEYNIYETDSEIPIVKNFTGIRYNVKSEMEADYYVLFAYSSENELDSFIEEIVSNDFELTTSTIKHPMQCFRDTKTDGYKCISLIGIKEDWSYQVEPLGLVCIDNISPQESPIETTPQSFLLFKKSKTIIRLPENLSPFLGYAILSTKDFGGNGASCMVNFMIEFSGDVKSLTIKRNDILSKWVGKENKVINLEDENSPYYFTYELHLEEGDNYVPVIVHDLRGNKMEYKLNIPAHFERSESPQIEIDNNIDIWN